MQKVALLKSFLLSWNLSNKDKSYFKLLISFGVLFALLGIIMPKGKYLFAWLVLYIPMLWIIWIFYVTWYSREVPLSKKILLWLGISLVMLLFLITSMAGIKDWSAQLGSDLVAYTLISPLTSPISLVLKFFSENLYRLIFGNILDFIHYVDFDSSNNPITLWIALVLMMLPQTLLILFLTSIANFVKILKHNNQ